MFGYFSKVFSFWNKENISQASRGTSSETGFVFMVVRNVLQCTLRSFSIVFVRKNTVNLQVPQQILVIWPQFQAGILMLLSKKLHLNKKYIVP